MDNLLHFLSIALILYCVYQLGSLAGIFSERSGVGNIALDGAMIMSAVLFSIFYENLYPALNGCMILTVVFSLLLVIPLSIAWMMILAVLVNRYQANHFIAGTGMNLVAPALGMLLYSVFSVNSNGTLKHNFVLSMSDWNIPITTATGVNQDINWFIILFLIMTVIIVCLVAVIINQSSFGLNFTSAGENPYAVETAGVSVLKTRYITLAIAGCLCGLAGSIFIIKGPYLFTVEGAGFLSLGVMILGKYRIRGTIIASIVLASLIAGFETIPYVIGFDDSSIVELTYLFKIFPFIIPIIGMMVFSNQNFPAAIGQNFKKDQR